MITQINRVPYFSIKRLEAHTKIFFNFSNAFEEEHYYPDSFMFIHIQVITTNHIEKIFNFSFS